MNKVHYLLIFLIVLCVGFTIFLLSEDGPVKKHRTVKQSSEENVFKDTRDHTKGEKAKDYVQGAYVLPDLREGFSRCLGRGYSSQDKNVLRLAESIFVSKDFDEGKYRDNTIIYVDNYGEKIKLFHQANGSLVTYLENKNGHFIESKRQEGVSQEDIKDMLEGESILVNEYAQVFKKGELTMELLLSNGVMKFLNIITPQKKIACKP